MLKYTEGNIVVDDVKIHYYRTGGKKPPFILLHGATDNGLCWTATAESLAETYDVIMPDAQGHGLSGRLDKDFSFKSHMQSVAGLSLGLGLNKPVIMGHSMGAGTAANVAAEYPSLPKAIILEDPGWMTPESMTAQNSPEVMKQREVFRKSMAEIGKRTLEEAIAAGRAQNPRWSDAEIIPWAQSKKQCDPALFSKMAINARPYEELVPQIKCPVLLIIADGGLVSEDVAKKAAEISKSNPPLKWVQIKGATHNIRRDNFPDYINAVQDFLKSLK